MDEPDPNEALGPLLIAPPSYGAVRTEIRKALGFPNDRHPILIGIDGFDGAGKSSLAAWLSWQLEIPAIHFDVYIVPDSDPIAWFTNDLRQAVSNWIHVLRRPIIVESIQLLDVLRQIECAPDFYVFVEKGGHESSTWRHIKEYLATYRPRERADFIVKWSSAEHDARVMKAHRERG
jgi:hypothetical protein